MSEERWPCPYCKEVSQSRTELLFHMLEKHTKEPERTILHKVNEVLELLEQILARIKHVERSLKGG